MNTRTPLIASALLAASLISGAAHAALEGRDLNGSINSFEAYYDTDLNITWLADANYAKTSGYSTGGLMDWSQANTWAASLSFTDGVNIYDNWRLPTVKPVNGSGFNNTNSFDGSTDIGFNITSPQNEMSHMFYVTLGNPGYLTPTNTFTNCMLSYSDTCLDNVGPFSNLKAASYWSATEYPTSDHYYAYAFRMTIGDQIWESKALGFSAWAVSPGDVGIAAVPEADTWAMLVAGLALVGAVAQRRRQAEV